MNQRLLMDIYVVQPGDNINTIADKFNVSVTKLIQDNGLVNPYELATGQCIVIAYPLQTYIVKEGDTLKGIADSFGVTLMQLYRNNSFLLEREYIYPDETLVIGYQTKGSIETNGFTYPYINKDTLIKTLPSLTYLSIFNYRSTADGSFISFYDDTEIIQLAKDYGVIPLLVASSLSPQGQPNIEFAFNILLSEENQNRYVDNILSIIKAKGYYGINIIVNFISEATQTIYQNFLVKLSDRLSKEGYLFIVTINYNIENVNNELDFQYIDYTKVIPYVNKLILIKLTWGTNNGPPSPVISVSNFKKFLDYLSTQIPLDKIIPGVSLIGYNWTLPYITGKSSAPSLTLNSALRLASDIDAIIEFDDVSKTPFFNYNEYVFDIPAKHIVWMIDARSIDALNNLISEYGLTGIGLWNIMIYYPQIWLVIISQYEVQKLIPDIIG